MKNLLFTLLAFMMILNYSCKKEECPSLPDVPENKIILFSGNNFSDRNVAIGLFDYKQGDCIGLNDFGLDNEVSSVQFSLPDGVVVRLWGNTSCGNSEVVELRGIGEFSLLSEKSFDNVASSLNWDNE